MLMMMMTLSSMQGSEQMHAMMSTCRWRSECEHTGKSQQGSRMPRAPFVGAGLGAYVPHTHHAPGPGTQLEPEIHTAHSTPGQTDHVLQWVLGDGDATNQCATHLPLSKEGCLRTGCRKAGRQRKWCRQW
jgi:hypothetical protein